VGSRSTPAPSDEPHRASFLERVEELPRDSQLLLLTAAADPVGDTGVLWRAAERLGVALMRGGQPGRRVGRAGRPGPVPASARSLGIYAASSASDRCDVHRALADVTDPVLDPDRRAWHRAYATARPDERCGGDGSLAGRAQAGRPGRGRRVPATRFELTPDAAVRVERALTAAQAKSMSRFRRRVNPRGGRRPWAARRASARALGALAGTDRVRDPARSDAPALLFAAARRLEALDDA